MQPAARLPCRRRIADLSAQIESPFEAAVAAGLEKRGWQVATQIGVSAFRIDLGVKHPDYAGAYLAGSNAMAPLITALPRRVTVTRSVSMS